MNPMLRDELAAIIAETPLPKPLPIDIQFDPIDVSWRAKRMRAILRIADANNWRCAVTHFMETKGVSYLSDLTDPQLDDLLDRMNGYVDAAEAGCSLPDSLPAF